VCQCEEGADGRRRACGVVAGGWGSKEIDLALCDNLLHTRMVVVLCCVVLRCVALLSGLMRHQKRAQDDWLLQSDD
jgi:hypothetical protein